MGEHTPAEFASAVGKRARERKVSRKNAIENAG